VPLSLGTVLKAALIAGVVGGLAAAAFHFVATEPLIDRAIALETLRRQAEGTYEEPMISRDVQHMGLFLGFLLYGLTWSLLFAATYHLAQRWLPAWSLLKRGLRIAAAAYWSVSLFPFLKYPANPPGVGDPNTIGFRQGLYLGILALSIGGTVLAAAVARTGPNRWRFALAGLAVYAVVVYLVLPVNPDAILMPAEIISAFRVLSIAGLTVFWAVFGLAFGALLRRRARQVSLRPAAVGAS
jgi:predicted cobalt transporter CbtA